MTAGFQEGVLEALAIVAFVVLPAWLSLDLLAPGRHFGGARSTRRWVLGGLAAAGVGLGTVAAEAALLGPYGAADAVQVVLGLVCGFLLNRSLVPALERLARPRRSGLRLVTPAAWLDDRVGKLVVRACAAGLLCFGALRLPAAAGLAATLVVIASPAAAVAAAAATRVGFEERGAETRSGSARLADPGRGRQAA